MDALSFFCIFLTVLILLYILCHILVMLSQEQLRINRNVIHKSKTKGYYCVGYEKNRKFEV